MLERLKMVQTNINLGISTTCEKQIHQCLESTTLYYLILPLSRLPTRHIPPAPSPTVVGLPGAGALMPWLTPEGSPQRRDMFFFCLLFGCWLLLKLLFSLYSIVVLSSSRWVPTPPQRMAARPFHTPTCVGVKVSHPLECRPLQHPAKTPRLQTVYTIHKHGLQEHRCGAALSSPL